MGGDYALAALGLQITVDGVDAGELANELDEALLRREGAPRARCLRPTAISARRFLEDDLARRARGGHRRLDPRECVQRCGHRKQPATRRRPEAADGEQRREVRAGTVFVHLRVAVVVDEIADLGDVIDDAIAVVVDAITGLGVGRDGANAAVPGRQGTAPAPGRSRCGLRSVLTQPP